MNINQADELSKIALDTVRELQDELQDGWYEEALQKLGIKKRKVVPPEEFYSTEFPNEVEEPDND